MQLPSNTKEGKINTIITGVSPRLGAESEAQGWLPSQNVARGWEEFVTVWGHHPHLTPRTATHTPRFINHAESAMKLACSPIGGQMGEEKVLLASPLTLVFFPLSLLLCVLQVLSGAGAARSIGKAPPPPCQGQQWGGTGSCPQPSCPNTNPAASCGACERCLCPWNRVGTR